MSRIPAYSSPPVASSQSGGASFYKRLSDEITRTGGRVNHPVDCWRLMLSRIPFTYFLTLTYSDVVGFEQARKTLRQLLRVSDMRRSHWFAVGEFQKRGVLHWHVLAQSSSFKKADVIAAAFWSGNVSPICRVDVIHNQKAVANYVTKYILKNISASSENLEFAQAFKAFYGFVQNAALYRDHAGLPLLKQ